MITHSRTNIAKGVVAVVATIALAPIWAPVLAAKYAAKIARGDVMCPTCGMVLSRRDRKAGKYCHCEGGQRQWCDA